MIYYWMTLCALQWDQQTDDDHLTESSSSRFLTVSAMDAVGSNHECDHYGHSNHFSPPLARGAYVEVVGTTAKCPWCHRSSI
ncbi:hypothetical protein SCLCIDRAFT_1212233 [Scleroderma citrinum Foug A]|uniref:Uncharacterized protein n=1 Tax=Scleroderma citrinum Foug A TaxID=1036808 RepID=A0A0C2ZVI6_9AGAM|nr:hypothetical protein SCLCIDRAFT_1212233 [Scleroderma citrinum Foug A]